MNPTHLVLIGTLGAFLGAVISWTVTRGRIATLVTHNDILTENNTDVASKLAVCEDELISAREENSRLRERLHHYEERIQEQIVANRAFEEKLTSTFKALSSEALRTTSEQFSHQFHATARTILEQVSGQSKANLDSGHRFLDGLGRSINEKILEVDRSVKQLEKLRTAGDAELKQQLEQLLHLNKVVGDEASKLSHALTNTRTQGIWGEAQLRNVVEAAGMTPFCDFFVQDSAISADGDTLRPDMRVRLPNNLNVLIDAKAPTKAFMEAASSSDDRLRKAKMRELATALRGHIKTMNRRNYPAHYPPALEYTLLFLPAESLFMAAVEEDSGILSYAEEHKVILTTPLSLVAFLRAVSCGWTTVKVQSNAEEIQKLGQELFERMNRFYDRFISLGAGLESVVNQYNQAAATGRTLSATRRKFAELGAGEPAAIDTPEDVTTEVRCALKHPTPCREIEVALHENELSEHA